jgi:heme/copper-type cytochrome/quinol oxidase subunit 2
MRYHWSSFVGACLLIASAFAFANEGDFMIVIKDHRFQPAELTIPSGKRVKLVVDNQDKTPEEFESHDLRVEKVIPGNTKATIWIGPLKQGKYSFVGEFHEDTAKGTLISE